MKITYNFYDARGKLPAPIWIFETTRRIDWLMRNNPNKNWPRIRRWARPMNQITPGLFMNITDTQEDDIEKAIDMEGTKSEDLKLELRWRFG